MANHSVNVADRFHKYVMPEPNSGCWLWTGPLDSKGYGRLLLKYVAQEKKRPSVRAHRYSYELHKGEIRAGFVLDHLCRTRCCVNPDHLEQVTARVNILRGESLSAKRAAQTHCKNGHKFTAENTKITQNGGRVCRICNREWYRDRYARKLQRDRATVEPQCGKRSGYNSGCRCVLCRETHNARMREQRAKRK